MPKTKYCLKVIPLGGVQEIGKNITVLEYEDDIIVLDCGLAFPEDEMLGIDLVIPDVSYLIKNKERIKGIILTHGHEDHIGAIPYVLKEFNVPVFGTKLTLGLLENKLNEHRMLRDVFLKEVKEGQTLDLGVFRIEFVRSTHSIADCVSLSIDTPVGTVIYTSDFKIDYTPIEGPPMDLVRLAEIGRKGVLLMMCDSTNVEHEGYTMSERTVGSAFDEIFMRAGSNRILVATFASNVHRIQQVINAACKFGRKVAICGRSVVNVISVANSLGYLDIPDNTMIDIDTIDSFRPEQLVIITTGSQGEPMSALTRIAASDYKKVEIIPGDLVIISASAIPGNEKLISRVIDGLFKRGAEVIYERLADIHVSGHACQEELKLIHTLIKPRFFMPVHGEYKHLKHHANLAVSLGMSPDDIFVMSAGKVLELDKDAARLNGSVTSGIVLVDGLGVGDVGNVVLRDRKMLSQNGLLVVVITADKQTGEIKAGPDIISRGFVFMKESEDLIEQVREVVNASLKNSREKGKNDWFSKKTAVRESVGDFLYAKTKRNPMILPIVMEV